jgi:hypothetical protein
LFPLFPFIKPKKRPKSHFGWKMARNMANPKEGTDLKDLRWRQVRFCFRLTRMFAYGFIKGMPSSKWNIARNLGNSKAGTALWPRGQSIFKNGSHQSCETARWVIGAGLVENGRTCEHTRKLN